jgi:prevent-host-death family protein
VAVAVGIRELRENLRSYLERVKSGEELLVTERGKPIARIMPEGKTSRRDELIARGTLTPAKRPWDPRILDDLYHVDAPLSDLITRDRDTHY